MMRCLSERYTTQEIVHVPGIHLQPTAGNRGGEKEYERWARRPGGRDRQCAGGAHK